MQEYLAWAGLLVAIGTVIAAIVRNSVLVGRAYQRADDANKINALNAAGLALQTERFNSFQIEVARTYVSAAALKDAMGGLNLRLDSMTNRLDSLISLNSK